jgi:hypothetical protein
MKNIKFSDKDKSPLKTSDLELMDPKWIYAISNSTSEGPLYMISNEDECNYDKVVKFSWAHINSWEISFMRVSNNPRRLLHEQDICRVLYDNGVSVPEPIGVFKFREFKDSWRKVPFFPRYFPGFVMQNIQGTQPFPKYSSLEEQKMINQQHSEAVKKVNELGIIPIDLNFENALWVSEEQRLYLVDFGKWMFKGETLEDFW